MKRFFLLVIFLAILGFSLMPVFTKNNNSILIPSVEIKENQKVTILENHPTEYSEINVSFEKLIFLKMLFLTKMDFVLTLGVRKYSEENLNFCATMLFQELENGVFRLQEKKKQTMEP